MNLHAIVRGAITSVNPDISISLLRSTGYTTDGSGKQVATYVTLTGPGQVQACTPRDIEHANNLNIQGVLRTVYLYGTWMGVVRSDSKGGDVLQFPQVPGGPVQNWRVYNPKETWPDWSCVNVVLQAQP